MIGRSIRHTCVAYSALAGMFGPLSRVLFKLEKFEGFKIEALISRYGISHSTSGKFCMYKMYSFIWQICLGSDRVRLLELIRLPVIIGTVTSIAVFLSPALASIQRVRLPTVFHVPVAPRARSAPTQTCVLQPRSCCLGCASAYSLATSHAMLDRGSMLILLVLYFCYLLRGTLSSDFQAGIAP